MAKKISYSKI